MDKTQIITKWYNALNFPKQYNDEFNELLAKTQLPNDLSISEYKFSKDKTDGGTNLLVYLYLCEELEKKYTELGLPDKVLMDTLSDVVYWTGIHYTLTGALGLSEFDWLNNHLNMKLFRIGRLDYCYGICYQDIEEVGVSSGDTVMTVHIPAGDKLDNDECKESIEAAKTFFEKYFPDKTFKCFTCSSWLLDETLEDLMKPTSNILKFQRLFSIVGKKESYSALKYTVRWDATPENMNTFSNINSFAQRLVNHVSNGGKLYAGFGYIEK